MTTVYNPRIRTRKLVGASAHTLDSVAEWENVCPLAEKGCEGSRDLHYFERVCSKSFRDCYEGTIANEEEDK